MNRRRPPLTALACAALALAPPAVADAAWSDPQLLGPASTTVSNHALASNAAGDTVAVFSESSGISVARAAAGGSFGPRRRISRFGDSPRVAIDARGIALIAFSYNDETDLSGLDDRGGEACCIATMASVWRPGHAPTRPRHVRRRGLGTFLGPLAAARAQRGVLVNGADAFSGRSRSLQFVPVRLDGRPGRPRRVAGDRWAGATLQYVRGRAVVGLIDRGIPARLAVRRQRRAGTFGTLRVFRRIDLNLESSLDKVFLTADGRGGQVAVWQRGRRPGLYLQVGRKPLAGRLRVVTVRRGPAQELALSAPAASPDGWVALVFTRRSGDAAATTDAHVVALRPDGSAITTPLPPGVTFEPAVASVTRGGAGAVGGLTQVASTPPQAAATFRTVTSLIALEAGVPQPAQALVTVSPNLGLNRPLLTSNPRDRARALFEDGTRRLLLTSRLE